MMQELNGKTKADAKAPATGVLLLAGGQSRRMGREKAGLVLGDGQTFLQRLAGEFSAYEEKLLSVGAGALPVGQGGQTGPSGPAAQAAKVPLELAGYETVEDVYPGAGPLAGIQAGLARCRSAALLVLACDAPLVGRALGDHLVQCAAGWDAAVAVTRDGRVHPLCGVYQKHLAEGFAQRLAAGQNRVMGALETLRVRYVQLAGTPFPDRCLANINTPGEYDLLLQNHLSRDDSAEG